MTSIPFAVRLRICWRHWLANLLLAYCAWQWANVFGAEPDLSWLLGVLAALGVTVLTGIRADEALDDWIRLHGPQFPAA